MAHFFTNDEALKTLLKDFALFPFQDVVKDWRRLLIFDEEVKDTFFDYEEMDQWERALDKWLQKNPHWQKLVPLLQDAADPAAEQCIYHLTKNCWHQCYPHDNKLLFVRERRFDKVEHLKSGDILAAPNGLSIYAQVILDEYLQPYRKAQEIAQEIQKKTGRQIDSGYLLPLTTEDLIDNLAAVLIHAMQDLT